MDIRRAAANWSVNSLLFLLPFLVVEAVFRSLPVSKPPYILPVSAATPVARLQPNVDFIYSRDWNFSVRTHKRSNNFGYVHQADYRLDGATPLLVVIGDSYVEARAIEAGESAAEILHSRLAGTGRVYSIGLAGAPLSQYLAFAEFAKNTLRPDAMAFLIGGNDFDESLLKYQSNPTRFHYFADNGELRRVDYQMSTIKKILRESAFLRYLILNLEPTRRLEAMRRSARWSDPSKLEQRILDSKKAVDYFLDQLASKSGLDSRSVVFVLDAVRPEIYSPEVLQSERYHTSMRRYFGEQAKARGYQVLDMQPVFIAKHARDGSRFEAAPTDGHWNALANRVVADQIERSAVFARVFPGKSTPARPDSAYLLR
jgi:hypothetical protein